MVLYFFLKKSEIKISIPLGYTQINIKFFSLTFLEKDLYDYKFSGAIDIYMYIWIYIYNPILKLLIFETLTIYKLCMQTLISVHVL